MLQSTAGSRCSESMQPKIPSPHWCTCQLDLLQGMTQMITERAGHNTESHMMPNVAHQKLWAIDTCMADGTHGRSAMKPEVTQKMGCALDPTQHHCSTHSPFLLQPCRHNIGYFCNALLLDKVCSRALVPSPSPPPSSFPFQTERVRLVGRTGRQSTKDRDRPAAWRHSLHSRGRDPSHPADAHTLA